ncbi:MAG: DUF4132 domain-containing protein [Deltaproteobacteria bacterium]|jgi:hypothetical protein|nr:DUF4132 domain-containing protein [Deltaproteobacteria bacterium]
MTEPPKPVRSPSLLKQYEKAAASLNGPRAAFGQELWEAFKIIQARDFSSVDDSYYYYLQNRLDKPYEKLCGLNPAEAGTLEDFWNPKLVQVLKAFAGPEKTAELKEIAALALKSPYAHSTYRPSYRSPKAGDYAQELFQILVQGLNFLSFDLSAEETLKNGGAPENYLALALIRQDPVIEDLAGRIVMGDSGDLKLSHGLIRGIIKSGSPKMLEQLGRLLLAAKSQEGLRQSILENADAGTAETHAYFLKLCLDNELYRFSAVIRSLGTWSGLAFDSTKPAAVKKCFQLAQNFLLEETIPPRALESPDVLELYLALWAGASRDIYAAQKEAEKLLSVPEKYRRLAAWYFVHHTVHPRTKHETAVRHLGVRDPEELAWVSLSLYQDSRAASPWRPQFEGPVPDPNLPAGRTERRKQFERLLETADYIGNKKTRFEESVFPWYQIDLDAARIYRCLLGLAAYDLDPELIARLADRRPAMDASARLAFYTHILDPDRPEQRRLLIEALSDKSTPLRKTAVEILGRRTLGSEDIEPLAKLLFSQSSSLRQEIMTVLSRQSLELTAPAIRLLMNSKNPRQLLAGLELLEIVSRDNPPAADEYREIIDDLKTRENLPQDTAVILKRFERVRPEEAWTPENGFGLYDPDSPDLDPETAARNRPPFHKYSPREMARLLEVPEKKAAALVQALADFLIQNQDREFEIELYDHSRSRVLLGSCTHGLPLRPAASRPPAAGDPKDGNIWSCYLAEEVLEIFSASEMTPLELAVTLARGRSGRHSGWEFTPEVSRIFQGLPYDVPALDLPKLAPRFPFTVLEILRAIFKLKNPEVFRFSMDIWQSLASLLDQEDFVRPFRRKPENNNAVYYYEDANSNLMINLGLIWEWRSSAYTNIDTEEDFSAFWREHWYQYLQSGCLYHPEHLPRKIPLLEAFRLNLAGPDGLYFELLSGSKSQVYIQAFTGGRDIQRQAEKDYPFLADFVSRAVSRIYDAEEKRGELPAPLTKAAFKIGRFAGGSGHFVRLLAALGRDNFHRGWLWNEFASKQEGLSALLKRCQPHPAETAGTFKESAAQAKISRRRLLEAVMYAPQWAALAEEALEIPGLAEAVWFFHAHVSGHFSAEKETNTALYSPISPEDFAAGTFDRDWFLSARKTAGPEIFDLLYASAKYITDSGSAHRRSQLYTDAVLGRLDKGPFMEEIAQKRNQEKLRALGLIPLDPADPADTLQRYEFIQKFIKESRSFGSARQASEGLAAAVALQNLALTSGFGDISRLSWYLESEKMAGLSHLTTPQKIQDYEVSLDFGLDGTPAVLVKKDEAPLKTLPKALAKNERVLEIQAAAKDLKEQKKRSRLSLESALVSRTVFTAEEIIRLLGHPGLTHWIRNLVFRSANRLGFPRLQDRTLVLEPPAGQPAGLNAEDRLLLAHPHDFMEQKSWSLYQSHLFQNRLVQPFKQVFREYYPLTEDERFEGTLSRRYAGHQVQPQKTLALLKNRGWTVDYEEGLQKVFLKENLLVRLYALADWFSPADIEAPVLEVIRFYSKDKNEVQILENIPPVLFSEVMRDIDLAVSIAHAGGVDPEASQSTVEMRTRIARELVSLLGLANVSFSSSQAVIDGRLGHYSVHLGSAVIHQSGVGMLAVLPVHSQARGRIFLPFADDDPKTAEVMSKILLLAEDHKIKDPSILSQMKP